MRHLNSKASCPRPQGCPSGEGYSLGRDRILSRFSASIDPMCSEAIAVAPFVWTVFSVFKWKNCSANRRRGCWNVKIGFIDFQGLVGRAENSSIVFRAFHETGISTGLLGRALGRLSFWRTVEVYLVGSLCPQAG